MPAWFRTRTVGGRRVLVELLEDGHLLLEPERDRLDADEVRWLDGEAMPELRHQRAMYEVRVRQQLRHVHEYRPPTL